MLVSESCRMKTLCTLSLPNCCHLDKHSTICVIPINTLEIAQSMLCYKIWVHYIILLITMKVYNNWLGSASCITICCHLKLRKVCIWLFCFWSWNSATSLLPWQGGYVFSSIGLFVCRSVCLSFCEFVSNITQKVMNRLCCNFMEGLGVIKETREYIWWWSGSPCWLSNSKSSHFFTNLWADF